MRAFFTPLNRFLYSKKKKKRKKLSFSLFSCYFLPFFSVPPVSRPFPSFLSHASYYPSLPFLYIPLTSSTPPLFAWHCRTLSPPPFTLPITSRSFPPLKCSSDSLPFSHSHVLQIVYSHTLLPSCPLHPYNPCNRSPPQPDVTLAAH